jgi:hypothetical protein
VLALLSAEDSKAFLVDVRPEEAREEEGTAALKLGARFRVAAFPRQVGLGGWVGVEKEWLGGWVWGGGGWVGVGCVGG